MSLRDLGSYTGSNAMHVWERTRLAVYAEFCGRAYLFDAGITRQSLTPIRPSNPFLNIHPAHTPPTLTLTPQHSHSRHSSTTPSSPHTSDSCTPDTATPTAGPSLLPRHYHTCPNAPSSGPLSPSRRSANHSAIPPVRDSPPARAPLPPLRYRARRAFQCGRM